MGYCRFLSLLLISALLSLSLSQGLGRRIGVLRPVDKGGHSFEPEEESSGREMVEMEMDYKEPGANTNPRSGNPFDPPLRPPPP
ncbi:Calmegin [Cocos nucifera]|uniref:Calmegin n=1 Tax=Cocos nucifera TaxID=13894 RepID=A0A8K0I249_COCNU|nr:Calmegin [Cocos nucifera]